MLEDKLLIWKFNSGDRTALARIYKKYKNDLLRMASGLLNQTSIAEDIVHDVFVSIAQSPGRLKPSGNLKGYLVACVVNRVRNTNQVNRRRQAFGHDGTGCATQDSCNPDGWIIRSEEFDTLNHALDRLPYHQREVVILHLQGGMRFTAIAKSQNVSINTVQSRYRYGLEKLRSLLCSEVHK